MSSRRVALYNLVASDGLPRVAPLQLLDKYWAAIGFPTLSSKSGQL